MSWAVGIDDLAVAVTEGRPPRAGGEQAAHVVDVMETIIRAAAEGKSLAVSSRFKRPAPATWAGTLALQP